jgi:hypothetical protein
MGAGVGLGERSREHRGEGVRVRMCVCGRVCVCDSLSDCDSSSDRVSCSPRATSFLCYSMSRGTLLLSFFFHVCILYIVRCANTAHDTPGYYRPLCVMCVVSHSQCQCVVSCQLSGLL